MLDMRTVVIMTIIYGFAMIAFRDMIPDLYSVIMANLLIIVGLMFVLDGFPYFHLQPWCNTGSG